MFVFIAKVKWSLAIEQRQTFFYCFNWTQKRWYPTDEQVNGKKKCKVNVNKVVWCCYRHTRKKKINKKCWTLCVNEKTGKKVAETKEMLIKMRWCHRMMFANGMPKCSHQINVWMSDGKKKGNKKAWNSQKLLHDVNAFKSI